MEVKAIDLSPGDRLACEDGSSRRVKKIGRANWIRTAEGPCVWIFFTDGGDGVFGKSDVFQKVA